MVLESLYCSRTEANFQRKRGGNCRLSHPEIQQNRAFGVSNLPVALQECSGLLLSGVQKRVLIAEKPFTSSFSG